MKRKRWQLVTKADSRGKVLQKTVRANTKSEALAAFKKILGAPRVPATMTVVEVPV